VDIDSGTLNVTAANVAGAITPRTRAMIVVHTFGRPADLDPILHLAATHGVKVIEDACEALGAEYRGRRAGGSGDFGVFGFYPNKPVTTGEGGMLVTRDRRLAETIRALRNQGRRPSDGWADHSLLGYNYRLSEIHCALGASQMKRMEDILARRENRAACYCEHLRMVPGLTVPVLQTAGGRVCWFVFVVRLADCFTLQDRDRIVAGLASRGIECGRYFSPLHRQPLYAAYADGSRSLAVTEQAAARTLALPFFNRITDGEIADVCRNLREVMETA